MRSPSRLAIFLIASACAWLGVAAGTGTGASAQRFASPEAAVDAFIDAAERFDVGALKKIFGSGMDAIFLSGEPPQDRQRALDFARQAREKRRISLAGAHDGQAILNVGPHDWPFPVPLVKRETQWSFDSAAGLTELLHRRIGANELDAIEICRGYVEAQHEYAERKRSGYEVNQYAQRIISTSGRQDGLAWRDANGQWDGPIGENIAQAIQAGYDPRMQPYHGYRFKILKGQGPAARFGAMDFVVKGVMIGGFALVAAPAQYGITAVKSFIVSHDGVVFEKDLGARSLEEFKKMDRFNPDASWTPVHAARG